MKQYYELIFNHMIKQTFTFRDRVVTTIKPIRIQVD